MSPNYNFYRKCKEYMKKQNELFAIFASAIIFVTGFACNPSKSSQINSEKSNVAQEKINALENDDLAATKIQSPKVEKADFTLTSEVYDKVFTKKGAKIEDLKKYAGKNIAVAGKVSLISLEKKGATQPWVTLFAPGVLHGVSCYFDDDNLEQLNRLMMDENVKVQGFQDDTPVPEFSPRLEHCVVLEAN